MSVYRYVGAECELHGVGVKLKRFGQKVTLADDVAKTAIIGGAQLLPEDKFTFTDDECNKYPHPGQQHMAPAEYKTRMQAAWVAVAEYRQELEAQGGR